MRKTNPSALEAVLASTELNNNQKQAYSALYEFGPLTGKELYKVLPIDGIWKRLSELERAGVLDKVAIRLCDVTGYKAYAWDVNSNIPVDRINYKKAYEAAATTIVRLEQEISALKHQLRDGIPTEPGGQTRFL